MATEKSVRYSLGMKDGTSAVLAKVRKGVKSTDGAFGKLSKGLAEITIIGAGVSASLKNISRLGMAAAKGTVGEFLKFEKGMAEVSTITNLSAAEMAKLGVETQNFARKYAFDATEAAGALYGTISAGIDATNGGAEAFGVMGQALKFGKAALVDAESSTNLLTTVLNSYQLEADQASNVTDALFKTIKLGVTTGEELAGTLGRLTPLAAAAGVSFDDLSTGMVLLTRSGLATNEAGTALRELLVSIVNPTQQSEAAIDKLRLKLFNESTLRQEGGIFRILGELSERTGDSVGALGEVIPSIGALTAALAAAGQEGALPEVMAEIANRSGATEEALAKMTSTAGFAFDDLTSSFDVFKQRVGAALTSNEELGDSLGVVTDMVDDWADALLKGGEDGIGGFNKFIETLVRVWVPDFIDGMASLVLSMTQFGGTGREILGALSVAFDGLTSLIRKSYQGWQDLGMIGKTAWARLSDNDEALFALNQEYQYMLKAREEAEDFRKEMELAADGNFDAAAAGLKVATAMQTLAEELRIVGEESADTGADVGELTGELFDLGKVAAEVLTAGGATAGARDFAKELAALKAEVFDYKQGMADIPTAHASWEASIAGLSKRMHDQGATLEDQVGEWQILRGAIVAAWATAHEGQELADVVGQISHNVAAAAKGATAFEQSFARLKALVATVANGVVRQVDAEAALNEEARILNRLKAVTGETEEDILATKEAIRAEEEARAFAVNAGLPDVQAYVDLAMQNHELAILTNEEEEKRIVSIRERVAQEQEALDEYERSIEAMATSTNDAFGEIFASWIAGQESIGNGFNSFAAGLKKSLADAFLEPILGAESIFNELFAELHSVVTAIGKKMIETIKGWFAEKAAQRTLDATVGAATQTGVAAATAATQISAVGLMMPGLAAAATMALIATLGGAASAAGLLEPAILANVAMGEAAIAMAFGGRVTSPTLIYAGEDGEETVVPETKPSRARELLADMATRRPELFAAEAGGRAASMPGGGHSITINISGDDYRGDELARRISQEVDGILGRRVGR